MRRRSVTFHPNGTATVSILSILSDGINTRTIEVRRDQWEAWIDGVPLLEAIPGLSFADATLLATGATVEEWDKLREEDA